LVHNWGKQLDELSELEITPIDFSNRYTKLVTSPPEVALVIASDLVIELDGLVREWYNAQKISQEEIIPTLEHEWANILDCKNKVISAASTRNLVAVRYAAVEFAEFVIWMLHCLEGEQSDPRRFKKTIDALDKIPQDSQILLDTLLISMEIDELVRTANDLADLLKNSLEGVGIKPSVAQSAEEAKQYFRTSRSIG
jgi:hypothetical protein